MTERQVVVSLCIGDQVFGNISYWFANEELTIPDEAAETFLSNQGVSSLEIRQFGYHLLFPRESRAVLREAGVVRYVPP